MDVPAGASAASPAVPESVADGVTRSLDPRVIQLDRISGFIFAVSVAAAFTIATLIVWIAADTWWVPILVTLACVVALPGLAWFAFAWPPIDFRHRSYRVDERGIEIRHGVVWRSVENVPKSRVQHIDVSQGPLERRFTLGTLRIYTAGTTYALVALRGLPHDRALLIRDRLLPEEGHDAV